MIAILAQVIGNLRDRMFAHLVEIRGLFKLIIQVLPEFIAQMNSAEAYRGSEPAIFIPQKPDQLTIGRLLIIMEDSFVVDAAVATSALEMVAL